MNPYEAPQTVDSPPPKKGHWLWPDLTGRREESGWWPSLVIVAVIVFSNMLRSCSSPPSTPSRIPNSTLNQPPKISPAVQEILEKARAKRHQPLPQPLPKQLDQR